MIQNILKFVVIATANFYFANAECANGCNGHGKCTSYDMCICNRNWQANDCSERTCQFGSAHVDTPLGDLNADGLLSKTRQVDNSNTFPYGTAEIFPLMEDSDLNQLTDTAHYYMECSNKGTCDRASGECVCFDGYDGVACQRATCPNSCSGHGVCRSKCQLAQGDHGVSYLLWDKDISMGCLCDPGYIGPDCSERSCKNGVDPLYLDDSATIKFAVFDFAILTTASTISFSDGMGGTGYWAIRFFDNSGEDWLTSPISGDATCEEVVTALEGLPNKVVLPGTVICLRTDETNKAQNTWNSAEATQSYRPRVYPIYYNMSIWDSVNGLGNGDPSPANSLVDFAGSYNANPTTEPLSGYIYRLKFAGNPGAFRQPEIEMYLDGTAPSLVSTTGSKVITKVWTDGQQGENSDYFADHCDNVIVTIETLNGVTYLADLSVAEIALLKTCLGDADFDTSNNVDVNNWDYGNRENPHLVKLVRTVTSYLDGSYLAAIVYDSVTSKFVLLNPFHSPDFLETDKYEIYTTKGTLALSSNSSEVTVSFGSQFFYVKNNTYDKTGFSFDGDVSCDGSASSPLVANCLNKGDMFTVLNFENTNYNPPYINLYKANSLFTQKYEWSVVDRFSGAAAGQLTKQLHFMTHVIKADLSSNWGVPNVDTATSSPFRIYKFTPSILSTYNYVNECSNRGICARDTGLCTCFPGYTHDDCSIQAAIAV